MKFKIGQEVTQIGYQKIWTVEVGQSFVESSTRYLLNDETGNKIVEIEAKLRAVENNPIIRKG